MRRNRVLGIAALVTIAFACGFYSAGWYLKRNDISFLEPYSYCSFSSYSNPPWGGRILTTKYLEGITFKDAQAMIASRCPTWLHGHFVKDSLKYKLYRLEDANFQPTLGARPIIELQDVRRPDGSSYLRVTEVRDLSYFGTVLARVTTLGSDPLDESVLHFTKMKGKPYKDFPRGFSISIDRKLGFLR